MTLVGGILPNDKPVDHISSKALNAFSKGLKKFGIKTFFSYNIDELKVANIIVIWNMYNPIKDKNNHKKQLQELAKHNPEKFLISIERGFILRESQYVSVGYNGICGFGNYYNHNMPPDRLELLKITLAKRKINRNGYILFCGQLPRDTQVCHIDYYQWCQG